MENIIKKRKKTKKGFQLEDWPEHYLETVSCPICKENLFKKLYPKTYRRIVKCASCNLVFTNPRLKKKYLKDLYSEEYFNNTDSSHFGYENYIADEEKIIKTFSKRMSEIEKFSKKKGNLLDIGCATGFFMKAAKNRKWNVEGVEISEFAAQHAIKKYHFKIHIDDFLLLKLPNNYYDVITLWDVVEHFYDPVAALKKINKILAPGGILVLSTPDVESFPAKLTKDKGVGYKLSDEHLTYFSVETMKKLLESTGFVLTKKTHIGKHVSLPMLSDRVSIYSPVLGKLVKLVGSFLSENYFLYVNPFDIMCIYAKKTEGHNSHSKK